MPRSFCVWWRLGIGADSPTARSPQLFGLKTLHGARSPKLCSERGHGGQGHKNCPVGSRSLADRRPKAAASRLLPHGIGTIAVTFLFVLSWRH